MCDFGWSLLLRALRCANSRPAFHGAGTGYSSPTPTLAAGLRTRANNRDSRSHSGMISEAGSVPLVLGAGIARRLDFAAAPDFVPLKKNLLKPPGGDATDGTIPEENDSSGSRNRAASPTVRVSSFGNKPNIESAIGFSHIRASLPPHPWQAPSSTLVSNDALLFCGDVFLAVSLGEITAGFCEENMGYSLSSSNGLSSRRKKRRRGYFAVLYQMELNESRISSPHHHRCMREGARARVKFGLSRRRHPRSNL